MAIVNDHTELVLLFGDVHWIHTTNAFVQDAAQVYYVGYINTSNQAVVKRSFDGVSWAPMWGFGPGAGITLGIPTDGSTVMAAVWQGDSIGSADLYESGAHRMTGTFGQTISNLFYVGVLNAEIRTMFGDIFYAAAIGLGGGPLFTFGPGIGISIGTGVPIVAVFNPSPNNGGFYQVAQYSEFDPSLGWGGLAPGEVGNWRVDPINPSNPLSSLALVNDNAVLTSTFGSNGVDQLRWPGINSVGGTYSGFRSFIDFAGVSIGLASFSWFGQYQFGRALFFPGFTPAGVAKGSLETCDQGLQAPHRLVFSTLVDSRIVLFFIDAHGLLGSTVQDGDLAVPDATGNPSSFGPARIYGVPDVTFTNVFGPATQDNHMSCLLYVAGSIYRFTDYTPFNRLHAARTVLLSQAPADAPLSYKSSPPTANTALGSGRDTASLPSYDIALLRRACVSPNLVPNPNHSTGCSPVLRALLKMSGLAYEVTREIANDGQSNGHLGGNAIDVIGARMISNAGYTDIELARQGLVDICNYLRQVPTLFAAVIHFDSEIPTNSLYIYDGQVVSSAAVFGGTGVALVKETTTFIHIQSSNGRLLSGLSSPPAIAALGVGPAYSSGSGTPVTNLHIGQFGDRYVYVNSDQYTGGVVNEESLIATQDGLVPQKIDRW